MTILQRQLLKIDVGDIRRLYSWLFRPAFRIALMIAAALLCIAYLLQVSAMTATGYDLAALERQIEELKRENQRLSFEIAGHRSMTNIQERVADFHFVSIDTIQYLESGDAVVARR